MKLELVFSPTFMIKDKDGYDDYRAVKSRVIDGGSLDGPFPSLEDVILRYHPNATVCYIHEILFYEDNKHKKIRYAVDIE